MKTKNIKIGTHGIDRPIPLKKQPISIANNKENEDVTNNNIFVSFMDNRFFSKN